MVVSVERSMIYHLGYGGGRALRVLVHTSRNDNGSEMVWDRVIVVYQVLGTAVHHTATVHIVLYS